LKPSSALTWLRLSKISGIKELRILQEHYCRETSEQDAARL
jgi:hypothetical protein